jgi:hypothetical protein
MCPFCSDEKGNPGRLVVLLDEIPPRWLCTSCLFGGDASKFLAAKLRGVRREQQPTSQTPDLSDSKIEGYGDLARSIAMLC